MARARKTIPIADFMESVNRALAVEFEGNTPDYRRGLCAALEQALFMADRYKGFRFTDPAAQHTREGYLIPDTYDETRRHYL